MAIDPQARIDALFLLKRSSLFGGLGEEILQEIIGSLKLITVQKDVIVVREEEPGGGLYLIKSGHMRLHSKSSQGAEQTVAYVGRGDAVGELSLLTGEPYPYSAIAESECELLLLTKTNFDAILETHPLVGVHLSRALSRRLSVSFYPRQEKQKPPQLLALVPALPHETTLLFTVNLAISLVEQTRRKVLLLDLSPRSGDIARTLGLNPPTTAEMVLTGSDMQDIRTWQRLLTIHPSGLEIISINTRAFREAATPHVPALFSLLKDQYDFTLVLVPSDHDALCNLLMKETDKALFVTWDQAPDLAASGSATLEHVIGSSATPVATLHLQAPHVVAVTAAEFRIPWDDTCHQAFRETGTPYLASTHPATVQAIDRVSRAVGKLQVGLAMGSGAAYGYSLVGILKVFEREGIPIDLLAGTSMGALLGSFFCAGLSPEKIRQVSATITKQWLRKNMLADLTPPYSGFLAGQTLSAFLLSVLGPIEFHQLMIPFAAVATDIRFGQEVVLKEGRVVDAVRASTSLPIVFSPFLHKGRFLVDGGLVNPVPTSIIANMGADILISVNLTAKPSIRRGIGRKSRPFPLGMVTPNMAEVFFKMIYTMQYEIAQARTEIAHVVIAPDMRDFLWTEFHRSEEILKVGEAAAEEAVPKIKSLLPFFADYCKIPQGISLRAY